MAAPHIGFCPYLSTNSVVSFADWELGPLSAFTARWQDRALQEKAEHFLSTFTDAHGGEIKNPSLLCRQGQQIDGTLPPDTEIEALQAAIGFAVLDLNVPPHDNNWAEYTRTTDNVELFFWPINVDSDHVVVARGLMVRELGAFSNKEGQYAIRPPLDLRMPVLAPWPPQTDCLEAIYRTVLLSLQQPGTNRVADQIRVAVSWFLKAWRNTATLHFSERLVFLKTAFEALLDASAGYKGSTRLRRLFEALGITQAAHGEAEGLMWSPAEQPIHCHTYQGDGQTRTVQVTDLQQWFLAFAKARNAVIHDGELNQLSFVSANPTYDGPFIWTAERLLRVAVKVKLGEAGFPGVWHSGGWRIVRAACAELERLHPGGPPVR